MKKGYIIAISHQLGFNGSHLRYYSTPFGFITNIKDAEIFDSEEFASDVIFKMTGFDVYIILPIYYL